MDWVNDLYARYRAGEDPTALYAEYQRHMSLRPLLTAEQAQLVMAWRLCDPRLVPPQLLRHDRGEWERLTPKGTRLLLDAWDIQDTASK